MKKIVAFITLLCLNFNVMADAKVYFVDACSEKETKVSTPNGVRLWMEITGLDRHEGLEVKVIFRPAVSQENLKANDTVEWNLTFGTRSERGIWMNLNHVNKEGNFSGPINLPGKNWMRQVEERHGGIRVWEAEVSWNQPYESNIGKLTTSFYHSPSSGPYFQILSAPLCQWESEATVDSKLHENRDSQVMKVTRETEILRENTNSSGVTLGFNNIHGSAHPLSQFNANLPFLGWLFQDWQFQTGNERSSGVAREYTLLKNEAGVFVSRMSFNRHESRKFVWSSESSRCGKFVPVSSGFIDSGSPSDDFVVIPKEYLGRTEQLNAFIKKVRPAINNCQGHAGFGANYASDVIPTGKKGLLFYYIN